MLQDILQCQQGIKLVGYRIIVNDPVAVQKSLINAEFAGPQDIYFKIVADHKAFFFTGIHGTEGLMKDLRSGFVMSHNF